MKFYFILEFMINLIFCQKYHLKNKFQFTTKKLFHFQTVFLKYFF